MAYWQRKNGRVYIRYYDPETKKRVRLPRNYVSHLDGLADTDIDKWVDQWSQQNISKSKIDLFVDYSSDEVVTLIKAFLAERESVRKIDKSTMQQTERFFRTHILDYFVREKGQKDVRSWQFILSGFTHYLIDKNLSINYIKKVLQSLRQFSEYLVRNHILAGTWLPLIPSTNKQSNTPLPKEHSPQEIIVSLRTLDPDLRLLGLLGYFASLRPAETMALKLTDFYTGEQAIELASTQSVLHEHGVGSKLTVHIDKQRAVHNKDQTKSPKTRSSVAYVAVWYREGAKEIAGLLTESEIRLFPHSRDYYFRKWKNKGLPISLHDLRRSSGLYLGRTLNLPVQLVQEHMRHTDIKTTMLYMRRPEKKKVEHKNQDFNDVG